MKISTLCGLFDQDPDNWPTRQPSRALPMAFRSHMGTKMAKLSLAQDISRQKSPQRMGISVRDCLPGDPFHCISVSHYLKKEEIITRTDWTPGRCHVVILIHAYNNMAFGTEGFTKGQLAMAVCAVLDAVHLKAQHTVEMRVVRHRGWHESLALVPMGRWDRVYLLTDLFFNPSSPSAATEDLFENLKHFGFLTNQKEKSIFIVRDTTEIPFTGNPLAEKSQYLEPFSKNMGKLGSQWERFSGSQYYENLKTQWSEFQQACQKYGIKNQCLYAQTDLEKFLFQI